MAPLGPFSDVCIELKPESLSDLRVTLDKHLSNSGNQYSQLRYRQVYLNG